MGIGEKLSLLLERKCRNVNEVSAKTGISAQTIYSIIKRNNTKVDLDDLQLLADELGVPLDYFLSKPKEHPDEVSEMREKMHKRPELKVMFDLGSKITPEQVENINNMIIALTKDQDE